MEVLNMLFYTGITLGILVFIHELGHFLAAKLTGMRVDRFSIGFPPRAFGKQIGDTDYCISWIPLGGYVKIAGMVDESMDTDFAQSEPQPWEFRSKPMWARMMVICAGVIMNILLAVLIFWSIHYVRGKDRIESTEIGFVQEGSPAALAGLLAGDRLIAVNGDRVTYWDEVQNLIYIENLGNDLNLTIERDGRENMIALRRQEFKEPSEEHLGFFVANTAAIVNAVELGMPAEKLGLRPADTLTAVDTIQIRNRQQLINYIKSHAGKPISMSWKRGSETMSQTATVSAEGRIGISIGSVYTGRMTHIRYSLIEALPEGIREIGQSVRLFALTVGKIFSGKTSVKESFGGPIAIAQIATQSAELGVMAFLWFMAQLSMSLAILNILPIPALDGGHLILLIYEKITRREIPHKVKLAIQQAGFILLLAFMAFVIYNDISKF